MKKAKLINEFYFDNKDTTGNKTRIIVYNFDNGIIIINRFTVVPNSDNEYNTFIQCRSMFGKKVVCKISSFRLKTLKTIIHHSQESMTKAGLKLSDLV